MNSVDKSGFDAIVWAVKASKGLSMDARQFWDDVTREVERLAREKGVNYYGVDDFDCEGRTVVYANTGDSYIPTVCAIVRGREVEYQYIGWGDLIEQLELEEAE